MDTSLFAALKSLELPAGDFAIFGSGPLAIRRIITACQDLDVICRGEAWSRVCSLGNREYLPEYDVEIVNLLNGALTFGTHWGIGIFDIEKLIDSAEMIKGLPFVRMQHVVRYKQARSSRKDLEHLAALEKYQEQ